MSGLPAGALPLDQEQTASLQAAVSGLTPAQLHWVSGYAAGLAAAERGVLPVAAPVAKDSARLTVLYGSQTGNGEALALALAAKAREAGFAAVAQSLADFKPAGLKRETLLTFVISTHGEGDPPDDAELFHEFLLSAKAPKFPQLKYAVLALGDSSYVNFCQTGREVDARLARLGAERLAPLLECDLDYDEAAGAWTEYIIAKLPELLGGDGGAPKLRAVETPLTYTRHRPFAAEVLANQKITGAGSSKDVRHIELSLEDSGLQYEPGDALAVIASNPPELVAELLTVLNFDGETTITAGERPQNLATALTEVLEITTLNLGFLRAWSAAAGDTALAAILADDDSARLQQLIETHQVIDVVRQYPATVSAAAFVSMLRPLSPRSYSISSSPDANPGEVHLTVAAVQYRAFDREHWGAASTHLARAEVGAKVSVAVDRNSRFRLPADDVPIVMIGPGTGVAPFRAFVEQRVERGASGDNWLFFGDRNFASDFLYQLEWQRHLKQGALARLDVAFSRDQAQKIYVQDRIRENAAELFRWIESGAVLYVCGDAKRMAQDVDAALVDVLVEAGGLEPGAAREQLKTLRRTGRYQRDVY